MRYPSEDQARDTFTPEELSDAIATRAVDKPTKILIEWSEDTDRATSNQVRAFADLADTFPNAWVRSDHRLAIVRDLTLREIEAEIVRKRQTEMYYSEDSIHYANYRAAADES